ncbi:hypothetical protein MKEN_00546400 [Mycena kentingensis (nom. inval.)]|nr:hypothetical protein MKEN_00546400 [Mycena kentingensis (nom. inval.)]
MLSVENRDPLTAGAHRSSQGIHSSSSNTSLSWRAHALIISRLASAPRASSRRVRPPAMPPPLTPEQAQAALRQLPLGAPFIAMFLFGLYTWLFFACMASIWRNKRSILKTWGPVLVALYICATIHIAVQWQLQIDAFTKHGGTPDLYLVLTHPPANTRILSSLALIINIIIPDSVLIWRCWIVWGRSWLVVVIPILAAIGGSICAIIGLAGQIAAAAAPSNDPAAIARLAPLFRFGLPAFSLSLAVTLWTTIFICLRIFLIRRFASKHLKDTGANSGADNITSPYASIIEMLLESSALYSASLLVYVVFIAMKSENQVYAQDFHPQISGIAPTLLMYRISLGHARREEEWRAPNITSFLRFSKSTRPTASTLNGSEGPSELTFRQADTSRTSVEEKREE